MVLGGTVVTDVDTVINWVNDVAMDVVPRPEEKDSLRSYFLQVLNRLVYFFNYTPSGKVKGTGHSELWGLPALRALYKEVQHTMTTTKQRGREVMLKLKPLKVWMVMLSEGELTEVRKWIAENATALRKVDKHAEVTDDVDSSLALVPHSGTASGSSSSVTAAPGGMLTANGRKALATAEKVMQQEHSMQRFFKKRR